MVKKNLTLSFCSPQKYTATSGQQFYYAHLFLGHLNVPPESDTHPLYQTVGFSHSDNKKPYVNPKADPINGNDYLSILSVSMER